MSGFDQVVTFIRVADLDASEAFYGGALGLEMVRDQGPCRIFRAAGSGYIGVCDQGTAVPEVEGGRVILTLVADDVEAWAERLRKAGVAIEKGPADNDTFRITHIFVRDPDGYLVEIQCFWDPLP